MSRAAFFASPSDDASLRAAPTETLRASPHAAFAWETPPVSAPSFIFTICVPGPERRPRPAGAAGPLPGALATRVVRQ